VFEESILRGEGENPPRVSRRLAVKGLNYSENHKPAGSRTTTPKGGWVAGTWKVRND